MTQVFYRKWRPQAFSEVVGQEPVTQTLRRAIETGKIAHAYLFSGPRGTGKTSTARILAKAVNCTGLADGEPCNACPICQATNQGKNMDIIEIDAASNRRIEEIRELRERVNYSPAQCRYKVYIVDEVHMLTDAAANALLKTLEEPPPYVIFILATTEAHTVPATILSRCQRFDFRRLPQSAAVSKLQLIARKEGVNIAEEALRLIARVTTGSLRDAENLLEQMVTRYGTEIGLQQVQEVLGVGDSRRAADLARHILGQDLPGGLRAISQAAQDGVDLRQFHRELVGYLRELMLVRSGPAEIVEVTADELADMKKLAAGASLEHITRTLRLFSEVDLRTDSFSSLPLELALVECLLPPKADKTTAAEAPRPRSEPVRTERRAAAPRPVEAAPPPAKAPAAQPDRAAAPPVKAPVPVENAPPTVDMVPGLPDKAPPPEVVPPGPPEPVAVAPAETQDLAYLQQNWRRFVNSLRGEGSAGTLDARLRSACKPVALDGNIITLGFNHQSHKEKIEDAKYQFLINRKLHEVFGRPYQIACVLIPPEKRPGPEANPLVKAALDRGARIISVTEKDT